MNRIRINIIFYYFLDPCESNPCNKRNSYCIKESATEYRCECNTNYVPKSGGAKKYGCEEKGNYILGF